MKQFSQAGTMNGNWIGVEEGGGGISRTTVKKGNGN
jgi:hypothetical protein